MPNFQKWLNVLKDLGYSSYYEVLNAKDYGIPQNRDRVFCVSIFGDYEYTFPEPIPLTKRLKDVLENEVDEKYYINTERAEELIGNLIDRGILPIKKNECGTCGVDLTTNHPEIRDVANCVKAAQRGITNFRQDEFGAVVKDNE